MDRVSDKEVPNAEDRARALSWALDAPASALLSVHTGFETAEKTIAQLLEYVEEFLEGIPETVGTKEDVRNVGIRIQNAADRAITGLEDAQNG